MSRKIIRISGSDTQHFLQGLVTNDVSRLADGPVYAALLTPQGKYMADFFLVQDGADVLDGAGWTGRRDGLTKNRKHTSLHVLIF